MEKQYGRIVPLRSVNISSITFYDSCKIDLILGFVYAHVHTKIFTTLKRPRVNAYQSIYQSLNQFIVSNLTFVTQLSV